MSTTDREDANDELDDDDNSTAISTRLPCGRRRGERRQVRPDRHRPE